jgi:hypothetical protein
MLRLVFIFLLLCLFDAVWLTFRFSAHSDLFQKIQKSPLTIRWLPALLVYVLIACALYYFVFELGKEDSKNVTKAFGIGAALGFSMYGLYDLTNFATLQDYTLNMTILDITWGTVLCGSTAAIVSYIFRTQ